MHVLCPFNHCANGFSDGFKFVTRPIQEHCDTLGPVLAHGLPIIYRLSPSCDKMKRIRMRHD